MSADLKIAKVQGSPFFDFLSSFLALAVFLFLVFPLGAFALIGGRLVYGSWHDAWFTYLLSGFSGLSSILGAVPLLGVYLHWWVVENWMVPWAANHGVRASWLTDTVAASGSVIASVCWAALGFRLARGKTRRYQRPGPLADLRRVGLPGLEAPSPPRRRIDFWFWANTMTAVTGLALVVWLYRSLPAYIVVAVFSAFAGFGILKK